MTPELRFHDDPAAFLVEAGTHLAESPVIATVVATNAERAAAEAAAGVVPDAGLPHRWWAVVREGGRVVGAAMRTAPFAPYPLFVLPMPEAAARGLARALHERGEEVGGVNGTLPAARTCAEELARLTGGEVAEHLRTRLHRLEAVVPPRRATGEVRAARAEEVDLVLTWFEAFSDAADEQAGRPPGTMRHGSLTREDLLRRLDLEQVWLWTVEGEPVHLTAMNPPAFGVARIAPVYTPPAHRGRGYAGNTVAAVSQRLLDEGVVPCLYTDRANPTSNALYATLGYRPVADMVDLLVTGGGARPTPA